MARRREAAQYTIKSRPLNGISCGLLPFGGSVKMVFFGPIRGVVWMFVSGITEKNPKKKTFGPVFVRLG